MADGDFLDLLDYIARAVRGVNLPFGGICVIFVGDPLQLPCVVVGRNPEDHFFFRSTIWKRMVSSGSLVEKKLTGKSYRTSDPLILKILKQVRRNELQSDVLDYLRAKSVDAIPAETPHNQTRVVLFALREGSQNFNADKLDSIGGNAVIHKASEGP